MRLHGIRALARQAFTAALLLAATLAGAAEPFPERPIRIVVPFGAGGVNDVVARLLAEGMSRKAGVPVVVENRPGAGSVLGATLVARSVPDGHTLLMGANTAFTINPNLQKNLPFNPQADFRVVSPLFTVPIVLLARPDFPASNIGELVALVRKEPGRLSYGSFGQGSSSHLVMEWLKSLARLDIVHVPYAGGAAATQALLGGQVPVAFDALTGGLPQIKAGKLKAIALMQNAPSTVAPEISTTASSVFAEIDFPAWAALFAPAGIPDDRLQRLRQLVASVAEDPAFAARLASFGAEPDKVTPAQLATRIQAESARVARIVQEARINAD